MQEAVGVEVYLHAGGQQVAEVGLRGEACDGATVRGGGNHQPYVDTGEGGVADGQQHGVRRREVGGLEVEVVAALRHRLHHALHHGVPLVHGTGGDYLYDCVIAGLRDCLSGEEAGVIEEFFGAETPIGEEGDLELADGGADDAQLCVAPGAVVDSVAVAAGDIHAAGVACLAVDDDDFAVGAAVHLAVEEGGEELLERLHLDAVLSHAVVVAAVDEEVGAAVVYQAYVDALGGLADE